LEFRYGEGDVEWISGVGGSEVGWSGVRQSGAGQSGEWERTRDGSGDGESSHGEDSGDDGGELHFEYTFIVG
jgi:hypothetical protein